MIVEQKNSTLSTKKTAFKSGNYVVYPTHGVGKILKIKEDTIINQKIKTIVVFFEKDNMKLTIPYQKAVKVNLRHLISLDDMDEIFLILQSGTKKQKGMWSRRAQEYENKVNSGDIKLLAEVLRDLTRDISDADRSYSERLIYESALERLSTEYSLIKNIPINEAREEIISKAKNKMISLGSSDIDDDFDDDFDGEEEEEDYSFEDAGN
jgi:CarD family transcriptional regulator|tara:strand:- start:8180 stop:8806 length:627 start_codon:yes stop_codon:yes gene_type:complete